MNNIAQHLKTGGLVAFPTDTVWGLAVSPHSPAGIDALYTLKGRSRTQPLILLGACLSSLLPYILAKPPDFERLAQRFWPGPLTLIVPAANSQSIGLRIPNHPLALELLALTGPLFVTSANLTGHPPLSNAAAIKAAFPSLLVLDSPPAPQNIPSTIVQLQPNPHILRHGAITAAELGEKFH